MSWHAEVARPDQIPEIDSVLKMWEGQGGIAFGFASGDLGWALRNGVTHTAESLRVVRSESGEIAAIGTMEGDEAVWLTIDPDRLMDAELARTIAEIAVEQNWNEVSSAGAPARIRGALAEQGYAIDSNPWVNMWKPLTDADIVEHPEVVATSTPDLIAQRVAVNVAGFTNSTFTVEKWHSMASGASFIPNLDLVAINEHGTGVSALTCWLPGAEACGMIEPFCTHKDYRRQGWGMKVLRACFSELRKLGASGVRVYTPRGNDDAVATYVKSGFMVIDLDTTMVRQIP